MGGSELSVCARFLGALLYYPPEREEMRVFRDPKILRDAIQIWPHGDTTALQAISQGMLSDTELSSLQPAYQALFVGPHALLAPPWGSVYLEEDRTLFGESTVALRAFLRQENIQPQLDHHEPEDHIGLLFWAVAVLAESERFDRLELLWKGHMKGWVERFLDQMEHAAREMPSPFYEGVARLARLYVQALETSKISQT